MTMLRGVTRACTCPAACTYSQGRSGGHSHEPHDSCHFDVRVAWANDVGSGVIAAPVVVPDPERAGKHIITASYHQYVEVLDGEDGHPSPGWPFAFDHQEFVASPIWVDWDGDRTLDIVAVSKDGYVFFFECASLKATMRHAQSSPCARARSLHGNLHTDRSMRLPSLPVLRDWYEGLNHSDIMATFSLSDRQSDADVDKGDPGFDKVDWVCEQRRGRSFSLTRFALEYAGRGLCGLALS